MSNAPVILEAARRSPVSGGPRLDMWASCAGGLERETALELASLGWYGSVVPEAGDVPSGEEAGLTWERGAVYGTADLAVLYRTLWAARTVNRVVILLEACTVGGLDDIYQAVRELDLRFLPDLPFAVQASRRGEHPFRSPDIGRVAGQAVIDSHRAATGRRLPVDLDDPAVVVRVELAESRLRVGLEVSEESLHRRSYLTYRHPAALKATVAAALLLIADWRAGERLLDPMCGGGTIPIEAGLAALARPVGSRRLPRLEVLGMHRPDLAGHTWDRLIAAAPVDPDPLIRGLERYPHHVGGARKNLRAASLEGRASVEVGDATRLERIEEVDCVVTNPPYGIRVGRPSIIEPLYTGGLARIAECLRPEGRVVLLTPARSQLRRAARRAGLRIATERTVSLGALEAAVWVLR